MGVVLEWGVHRNTLGANTVAGSLAQSSVRLNFGEGGNV